MVYDITRILVCLPVKARCVHRDSDYDSYGGQLQAHMLQSLLQASEPYRAM
jgi:hypothetical protein